MNEVSDVHSITCCIPHLSVGFPLFLWQDHTHTATTPTRVRSRMADTTPRVAPMATSPLGPCSVALLQLLQLHVEDMVGIGQDVVGSGKEVMSFGGGSSVAWVECVGQPGRSGISAIFPFPLSLTVENLELFLLFIVNACRDALTADHSSIGVRPASINRLTTINKYPGKFTSIALSYESCCQWTCSKTRSSTVNCISYKYLCSTATLDSRQSKQFIPF